MNTADYDYDLPHEKIAIHPPEIRGSTKLMVLDSLTGEILDSHYANLDQYLEKGDVLVLNDTRVFNARLFGFKPNGKKIEFILLEKHDVDIYSQNIAKALYKGKIKIGEVLNIDREGVFTVKILNILDNGIVELEFSKTIEENIKNYGKTPIPPYLNRQSGINDEIRYQTTFAKNIGSVAAPTASLNMTPELIQKLLDRGIIITYLTLHVGLGTFLPIRTEEITKHNMHSEFFHIPLKTLDIIRNQKRLGKKIISVGTTVTRTIEYNWEKVLDNKGKEDLIGEANIFIYPGYEFKVVDGLLTNFHAPRSTVLMLASAFAGTDNLKNAYLHALENNYKFLSYGDSMFIV
ncbi:MAG: tRNA preQ1(34) S-adenosylmethionine ribosyltransferase-isomerase QueA [candidate division SR1 bacterium]|nr:tRNA preQ1(34) S-adenosylmethionine ribosyltransferase-isomerase QueA [candidate division SR1 bacterium]